MKTYFSGPINLWKKTFDSPEMAEKCALCMGCMLFNLLYNNNEYESYGIHGELSDDGLTFQVKSFEPIFDELDNMYAVFRMISENGKG